MRVFCTYFDHHYLPRGLALYESLRRHCPTAELWVLCLSHECHDWLARKQLAGVRLITLEEFERADPALRQARQNRSIVEYYFTCTPALPRFVFDSAPQADLVTYLDADLYFFRDPSLLFAEMAQASIAIIGHRFAPAYRHLEKTGVYNVGWISFRGDEYGHACLAEWRRRCLEWCYDRVEEGRYGDQKYLDQWPTSFPGVAVIQHKGANLAPWNLANYNIEFRDGRVWVDDQELLFFHFQGFQQINRWLYEPHLIQYGVRPAHIVRQHILLPYWRALRQASTTVAGATAETQAPAGLRESNRKSLTTPGRWRQGWTQVRRWYRLSRGVLRQRYLFAWPGQDEVPTRDREGDR